MTDDGSTQQPEQKPTKAKPTKYVVLRKRAVSIPPEGVVDQPPEQRPLVEAWVVAGEADAPNDTAAIMRVAGSAQGTFVAVPARSFRPKTRKVKQVEQTSWE